jgi:hypothetical protein
VKLESVRSQALAANAPALALAALAAYLAFTQKLLSDGDVFWHLATGDLILRTGSIPTADPFSYTAQGMAWHAHEWLAEVIMSLSYSAAAWSGVILLYALATSATLFILGTELARRLPVRWALCALFVVFMLLHPLLSARPHIIGWLLLAIWVVSLKARPGPPPFFVWPLMLVWANVHASYMLGLGIAGAFAIEGVLRDRSEVGRWAAFLAACLVCACLTPQGPAGLLYPFEVSGMSALAVIGEWRPTSLRDDPLFILFLTGVWVLVGARWRQIHPVRVLVLAGLSAMAIAHARHQMPFTIVGTSFVAPLLGSERPFAERFAWRWGLGLFVAVAAIRLAIPFHPADTAILPKQAIASVPTEVRTLPVFNSYSFGGPLILSGIKPYIDGRADMYGDRFTLNYLAILRGDRARFNAADQRWRFGWAILDPRDELANRLVRDRDWTKTYSDAHAVVYLREDASLEKISKVRHLPTRGQRRGRKGWLE